VPSNSIQKNGKVFVDKWDSIGNQLTEQLPEDFYKA